MPSTRQTTSAAISVATSSAVGQALLTPRLARIAFAAGTIVGFGGLLLQDQVPPLLVYCLQIFLSI